MLKFASPRYKAISNVTIKCIAQKRKIGLEQKTIFLLTRFVCSKGIFDLRDQFYIKTGFNQLFLRSPTSWFTLQYLKVAI
jgi:hypothetical protein